MKRTWTHHAAQQWPFALVALVLWCAMVPLALTKTQTTLTATTAHGEWREHHRPHDHTPCLDALRFTLLGGV